MAITRLSYNGVSFEIPVLRNDGNAIKVAPLKDINSNRHHPIIEEINTHWDLERFKVPRKPISVGEVRDKSFFSMFGAIRTLDMPIKMPGTDYRLPLDLFQFKDTLEQMIAFEHRINPWVDQYYAYVTVDQGWVSIGETQRKGGCHVDGFQGERIRKKNLINRSYVATDCLPTVFYDQSFNVVKLDEGEHNFFLEFDRQAKDDLIWRPVAYQILVMDAYTVHRADFASKKLFRTFLRLSYDIIEFDRLGNAHNPLFNYSWDMVPRDTQSRLTAYLPTRN